MSSNNPNNAQSEIELLQETNEKCKRQNQDLLEQIMTSHKTIQSLQGDLHQCKQTFRKEILERAKIQYSPEFYETLNQLLNGVDDENEPIPQHSNRNISPIPECIKEP